MNEEAPAPAGVPPKQKRGCLIPFVVAILLVLGGCLTLYLKRTDIGIYLIRQGIADQPWTQETQDRANHLVDRYDLRVAEGRRKELAELG